MTIYGYDNNIREKGDNLDNVLFSWEFFESMVLSVTLLSCLSST